MVSEGCEPPGGLSNTAINAIPNREEDADTQLEGLYQEIKEIAKILEREMKDILDWLLERYDAEFKQLFPALTVKVEVGADAVNVVNEKRKRSNPLKEEKVEVDGEDDNYQDLPFLGDLSDSGDDDNYKPPSKKTIKSEKKEPKKRKRRTKKDEISEMLQDMENSDSDNEDIFNLAKVKVEDGEEHCGDSPLKPQNGKSTKVKGSKVGRPKKNKTHQTVGPWERDEDIMIDSQFAFPTEEQVNNKRTYTLECKLCMFKAHSTFAMDEHNIRHARIEDVRKGVFFFCPHCDYASKVRKERKDHIKEVHSKEFLDCPVELCEHGKVSLDMFDKHLYNHHRAFWVDKNMKHENAILGARKFIGEQDLNGPSEPQQCAVCGHQTENAIQLLEHYKRYGDFHSTTCFRCGDKFRNWQEHQDHVLLKHDNIWKWRCGKCKKDIVMFDTVEELNKHLRTHINTYSSNEEVNCEHCGKMIPKKYVRSHNKRFHNILRFHIKCEDCTYSCKTEKSMKSHMERNHNLTACDICGSSFQGTAGVSFHKVRAHNIGGKYPCPMCGKNFNAPGTMRDHMNSHTGEKPYECDHCNQRFSDKSNRRNHIKQAHLGLKIRR